MTLDAPIKFNRHQISIFGIEQWSQSKRNWRVIKILDSFLGAL